MIGEMRKGYQISKQGFIFKFCYHNNVKVKPEKRFLLEHNVIIKLEQLLT